jgi:putative endonuclease
MADMGRRGERAAAAFLRRRGWRIHARRWRGSAGEIDIAAERGGLLALCEVKTRSDPGALEDPVPYAQRARLARTAEEFLSRHPERGANGARIDLILCRPGRLGCMRVARVRQIEIDADAGGRRPSRRGRRDLALDLLEDPWIGR